MSMNQFSNTPMTDSAFLDGIVFRENQTTVQEYLALRREVQWKQLTEEQARLALDNSLYVLGAYQGKQLIGMGRIVGDGAVICYIQDLMVSPRLQRIGLGSVLLDKLIQYVNGLRLPHSEMMLDLMCAKGREAFYEKHGFIPRPTEQLGPGMIIYINDRTYPKTED